MEMHAVKMRGIIAFVFLLFIALSFSVNGVDVSFNVNGATSATYSTFIAQFRNRLAVGTTLSNGLPVLNSSSSIPANQRFIVVTLTPYDSGISIGIGIDLSNVYVIAFRGNNRAYFLNDIPDVAYTNLFVGITPVNLSYSGSYIDLERPPGSSRANIKLGLNELSAAITNLWYPDQTNYRRSLIVIIQMLSEAARFEGIKVKISNNFLAGFLPSQAILSVENNWGALSSAIRSSVNGVFNSPVTLEDQNFKEVQVTTVNQAKQLTGISLLQG